TAGGGDFFPPRDFGGGPKSSPPVSPLDFKQRRGTKGGKGFASPLGEKGPRPNFGAGSAFSPPPPPRAPGWGAPAPPARVRREDTELLLEAVPELTGRQIVTLRQSLLELGRKRGWVDA